MAENSTIEWTDATWNPITGCSVVSPGCTNCYAMGLAGTRLKYHSSRAGLTINTKAGPVWNGKVRLNEEWLTQPLQWKRGRRIFVCAHGDLFAEGVPDEWIDRVFAVMALAPHHSFQVLTKRSARMRAYFSGCENPPNDLPLNKLWLTQWHRRNQVAIAMEEIGTRFPATLGKVKCLPLPNVWLGVSAEDQRRANERVPDLLATPAAVRFVSAEPLLGLIDFTAFEVPAETDRVGRVVTYPKRVNALTGEAGHHASPTMFYPNSHRIKRLDWIIVGGESGPKARPMHPTWARAIRDQCDAARVAFHFKQWGAWSLTHPDWPRAHPTVMANDGTLYRPEDLAYPDGARYGEAVRANHDKAHLTSIYRVGKKAAGRLLDGREHNGMPASAGASA